MVQAAPANRTIGVVVDDALEIREFLGQTGDYLRLPHGKAQFNLRTMARPELVHVLISAIQEARHTHSPVRKRGVSFSVGDEIRKVDIQAHRIEDQPLVEPIFQLTFEDVPPPTEKPAAQTGAGADIAPMVEQRTRNEIVEIRRKVLEKEENLRVIIEDYEVSEKKLIDANAALETMSTELEVTNDELEASNDELETVNNNLRKALAQKDKAEKERENLEQQVRHAEKLKSLGVLAGGIAHDFNNLLGTILGFSNLGLEELAPESPARRSFEKVVAAAERAAKLTDQMLTYSGKGIFKAAVVDLSRVVRESADLLQAAVTKKAALRYDLAEDLPLIEADPSQLQQMVMNFVMNASDATGNEGGTIRVATGVMAADRDYLSQTYLDDKLPETEYVYLEVSDTGCGMDREAMAKIFEPFFTTKFTGRGLGLASALGIVRAHGGAVKVSSEPKAGTAFRVLFPISKKPATKKSERTWTTLAGSRRQATILVVDDDEDMRTLGRTILEKQGLEVIAAADGREAIKVFRTYPDVIHVVLLDLTMPHMDGQETFLALRRIRPDVAIILCSGYDEKAAIRRFAGQRPSGFLQKPYRNKELVKMVSEILVAQ